MTPETSHMSRTNTALAKQLGPGKSGPVAVRLNKLSNLLGTVDRARLK